MTREETINRLKELKRIANHCAFTSLNDARIECALLDSQALDMAIEALQTDVVLCKDCRHRYEEGDCTHYYWCRLHDRPIDDTDFCAWGERKGGEDK